MRHEHFHCTTRNKNRIAAVSADGHKHPDHEVITILEKEGIKPYCTNLMPVCGANVIEFQKIPAEVDPKLAKRIKELSFDTKTIQPCQGNLTFIIQPNADISIERQFNTPCKFRGELSKLFGT